MDASPVHPAAGVVARLEEPQDIPAIRRVHEAAFEGTGEAALVDALREAGATVLSMVAVIDAEETGAEPGSDAASPPSVATWGSEGGSWGKAGGADDRVGSPGTSAGRVVGHVLVSPVTVATDRGEVPLLGLGPLGVLPEHQGLGIATLLVEASLERLREAHHAGVVVVGSPGFYSQFGFIPAARWGLRWETNTREEVFMALELSPGRLGGIQGVVRYRPEFERFTSG